MGTNMNTLIKLRNIFRDVFDEDSFDISENISKNDFEEWDSVAHIKLVLAIEEEFQVRLTTDEVASIQSVGEFMSAIQKHTSM